MTQRLLGSFVGRLAFYGLPVTACSVVGALLTRRAGQWPETNVLSGILAAALSLGAPVVIAGIARVERPAAIAVALVGSLAILVMWAFFSSSTSASGGFVFLWGLWLGIPLATALVLVSNRTPKVQKV